MKRFGLIGVFIISLFLVYSIITLSEGQGDEVVPVSPAGDQVTGNRWLFVIGISKYTEWPPLSTAANDARMVKDVLLKRYLFDEYHVIELYDEEATARNILGKLRYLSRRVGPDDSILIYYAGHGYVDSTTREGSWIPVDGGGEDRSSWITNRDVGDYLRLDAIKAKHILLLSDSCFSGDFLKSYGERLPRVTDQVIERAREGVSRQVVTSGGLKPVVGKEFGSYSVFARLLENLLEENTKPFLIPSDFFTALEAGVRRNTDQAPWFGVLMDKGEEQAGELVLFLKNDELERLRELNSRKKDSREHLRSSYRNLTVYDVHLMPRITIREEQKWGFYGNSTIRHRYEVRTVGYDKVVVDHATGLMWHQNGSERFMKSENIRKWIADLNQTGYAGYHDWRLPTAEEAASLLEPEQKYGDMYVDPVFDTKQTWMWTGDSYGDDAAWVVSACYGSVFWSKFDHFYSIRPVRSMTE